MLSMLFHLQLEKEKTENSKVEYVSVDSDGNCLQTKKYTNHFLNSIGFQKKTNKRKNSSIQSFSQIGSVGNSKINLSSEYIFHFISSYYNSSIKVSHAIEFL